MMPRAAKTHLVLLTDCLESLMGGAEKQIFQLARGLDKGRYTITVASLESEGAAPADTIRSIGCRLKAFQVRRIYGLSGFREGYRFLKFLKQENADILLTYHFGSDIWGTFWAKWAGVPVIISNRRDMGFWRNRNHVRAYRRINPYVTKIVAVARAVKNQITRDEGIPEDKITVIYNGVELTDRSENDARRGGQAAAVTRAELGIRPDDCVLMHVANFKPVKGHRDLIDAFAGIVKENKTVKLILIGEDELNGQLQKQVHDLNLNDHVLFLGMRPDAAALLALADICVLPSLSEGMSNAILEYMTAGKPVVATDVGGNPELVESGVTGILVPKENAAELKAALLTLISDPEKRQRLGQAGFQKIQQHFSEEKMIETYDNLFQSLCEK